MKFIFIAKKFFPQIILAILVAIFFIANPKSEKSFESALVNPKYEIDEISLLYEKEGIATISKRGAFWICDYVSPEGKNAVFPCDSKLVKNLLDFSRSVVKVYEISDSLKNRDSLGLSQNDAFCLECSQNGKTVSKIFFGAADSMRRIAFYVDKQKKIFCTDSAILAYLTLSPDFWCDPNIFPESVCDKIDGGTLAISPLAIGIEKDLSQIARLRHGKIFLGEPPNFSLEDLRYSQNGFSAELPCAKIDDGRGNIYQAFFMPTGGAEGDYFCRFVAIPSAARNESESLAIKSLDYVTTVSAWTFGRIFGE
ncbi:MAG: hypothetical protein HDR36_05580 [Treponema sp.]|nr:hypothetical protein [Treponema sp.]